MAKKQSDVRRLTPVITLRPPTKPFAPKFMPTCGCGAEAEYLVYDQPHCKIHMLEAIDCKDLVMVRAIGGYYDAS